MLGERSDDKTNSYGTTGSLKVLVELLQRGVRVGCVPSELKNLLVIHTNNSDSISDLVHIFDVRLM